MIDSFQSVLGQETAVGQLIAALEAGRVPHAYLFAGPAGVGKRTAARAWAKILLCPQRPTPTAACDACASCRKVDTGGHPDLLWVDFGYQAALLKEPVEKQKSLKIATVRHMEHELRLKPLEGQVKVAVISPSESLGDDASHALLKIIEEPPPGTHIVLVSSQAGSLLATIRSRCQRVRFRPLAKDVLTNIMVREQGHRPVVEVDRAVAHADGSVDRARQLLEEDGAEFPWTTSPLSELLTWCEGFQNPKLGRSAAERFVESLMGDFQGEVRDGRRRPEDLELVFQALTRLRWNANVGLTLQHLLLTLRRNARAEAV